MHALVTADTLGGVWTYVRELVTGLVRRGVQVTLVSFGDIPNSKQASWIDALTTIDYRPTAFRLEWMQDVERDIQPSSEYLASIIEEVKPDILHLNQYCYGGLPVDVPRIVVAHSDVVSWWVAVHGEEPPRNRWTDWYRKTVAQGIAAATRVIAPSQWMMDSICTYYTQPQQGTVVHNGRNRHLFSPHIAKEAYVLSVGRPWDAGKQLSILQQTDLPVPVYVAGSEEHPDPAYRYPNVGSSRSNVHFKGAQSEAQLRYLFARAVLYAATSRYEPFGLAPLEAALSRCAIVANDIQSFREIWGDSACYFRTNDPASLKDVVERLIRDDKERSFYANAAYDHALRHYTSDRMVDEYLELYRSAVGAEATAA